MLHDQNLEFAVSSAVTAAVLKYTNGTVEERANFLSHLAETSKSQSIANPEVKKQFEKYFPFDQLHIASAEDYLEEGTAIGAVVGAVIGGMFGGIAGAGVGAGVGAAVGGAVGKNVDRDAG